jgi:hypothetical protein
MVKPDHVLCWMFLSWVWGCCVLHQSVSTKFESVACLQGHTVSPELGLCWNFFEKRAEIFIFAPKGPYYWVGVLAPRPLQGPLSSSGRCHFFLCNSHLWGLINPHLGVASCLNFKSEDCFKGQMVKPDHVLCWMFLSWVRGCYILHQSMSSIFESVACLQGLRVRPEQSLYWNFFEWRAEIFIFVLKGPHCWGGLGTETPPGAFKLQW